MTSLGYHTSSKNSYNIYLRDCIHILNRRYAFPCQISVACSHFLGPSIAIKLYHLHLQKATFFGGQVSEWDNIWNKTKTGSPVIYIALHSKFNISVKRLWGEVFHQVSCDENGLIIAPAQKSIRANFVIMVIQETSTLNVCTVWYCHSQS